MDKIKNIFVSLIIVGACSGLSFAETEFTPLNFSDAVYTSSTNSNTIAANQNQTPAENITPSEVSTTTGSRNMQSAISQLDSAQVEVRNELMKYKTKYAEVDAKYNNVKKERADLAKQIKTCEKKIKQIDNTKEKIRKSME